jgi:transcription elongation factor Elf1
MKLILECQNCGNRVEMESTQVGQQVQMKRNLIDNDFYIHDVNIEKEGDIDDIDDVDDIETTLNSIRIDCRECGDFIVLEDF